MQMSVIQNHYKPINKTVVTTPRRPLVETC